MKEFLQQLFTFLEMFPGPIGILLAATLVAVPFMILGTALEVGLFRPIQRRSDKKASKHFWEQVRQGNPPEQPPKYYDRNTGFFHYDHVEFLHSAKAKRQLAGIKRIVEQQRQR